MSATSFKLLAAVVFLACGLGVGAGSGWMATADAQTPAKPTPPKPDPQAEVKRLQKERDEALRLAQEADARRANDLLNEAQLRQTIELQQEMQAQYARMMAAARRSVGETATTKTARWEYDFVAVSDMDQTKFVKVLQDREAAGWEFTGTTPLQRGGKPTNTWVFRRPVKGMVSQFNEYSNRLMPKYEELPTTRMTLKSEKTAEAKPDEAKSLEADIARLQARLAALKQKATLDRVVLAKKDLPLEPAELSEILLKLAGKKFKDVYFSFTPNDIGLVLEGDRAVIDWALTLIKKLGEK